MFVYFILYLMNALVSVHLKKIMDLSVLNNYLSRTATVPAGKLYCISGLRYTYNLHLHHAGKAVKMLTPYNKSADCIVILQH